MTLHTIELGSGPLVLILHGNPAPLADLLPLAQDLARDHHVVMPEMPGYGQSPQDLTATVDSVGDALAELVARYTRTGPRAVIGFSSGGYRALDLVLRRSVPAEVVVGLAALSTLSDDERALFRAVAAGLHIDPSAADVRPILPGRWLSEAWRRAHPEDDARVTAWLDLTSPEQLAADFAAQAELRDLRPLLPGLASRLYLRVGELDLATPPALSLEIAGLAPNATIDIVPGCGHALMLEDATQTIARVAQVVRTAA